MLGKKEWKFIPRSLIYTQLILVFLLYGVRDLLHLPDKVNYLHDIIIIALIPMCLYEIFLRIRMGHFLKVTLGYGITAAVCVFSAVVILSAAINRVPIPLFLWAVRNTFRYFAFFAACLLFLEKKDIDRFCSILPLLFALNLAVILVQFGILGLRDDHVGGLFGVEIPCNTYVNLFVCIAVAITACEFMEEKTGQGMYAFVVISSMLIAGVSELKVLYLEFVMIIFLVFCFNLKSNRIIPLLVYATIAVAVGLAVLYLWYPKHFQFLMNPERRSLYLTKSGKNQVTSYYINRIGAFKEINTLFFGDSIKNRIIGLGFGNCEESSLAIFTSAFAVENGWTRYRWFAHEMLYLETGYLGFGTFLAIFAVIALDTLRMLKSAGENRRYLVACIIFAVIILSNMWYNYGIRNEIAYLSYFVLAIPRILQKDKRDLV